MIYAIVSPEIEERGMFQHCTFQQLWKAISNQPELEFDIESNVTDVITERKATVYSFGIPYGGDKYVVDLKYLQAHELAMLAGILTSTKVVKLIHSAAFEYIVLYCSGIIMERVYCTYLGEQILDSGNMTVGYSLLDTVGRRFNVNLSKLLQTSFTEGIKTVDQIIYAADDVSWLGFIKRQQMLELHLHDLEWVAALEMEAVLSYSEMTAEGFTLDKEKWLENERLATPVVESAKLKMDAWLTQEPFKSLALSNGDLITSDTITINWNSHVQKRELFLHYFSAAGLTGATKPIVERFVQKQKEEGGSIVSNVLEDSLNGNYEPITSYILRKDKAFLVNNGYLLPEGTVRVNWNSPDQALAYARLIHPKMNSLDADSIAKTTHQFFIDLTDYRDALKLFSTYGQSFFKHVEPDNKVHSEFDQIKSTGRVSCKKPNLQQIPAKEHLENRYRNAFIPHHPDWLIADSDFASQELVVIADLSKDPVWLEALRMKQDLHSVCAELVFKDKWKLAAKHDCAFYRKGWYHKKTNSWFTDEEYDVIDKPDGELFMRLPMKAKCSCKGHKTLRNAVKTINFGLAYGMTEFKLAGTMQVPVKEAKKLIDEYFTVFPAIRKVLTFFEWFGITRGYILTPAPFFRKRFFPEWKSQKLYLYVDEHIKGIRYDRDLAGIGRQSKNAPIQGGSADSAKLSLVMIRMFITDNNLRDRVKIVMQVHDQNTTTVHKDYAETWKVQLHNIMLEAAKWLVPSGLLGAETNITPVWTK